MNVQIKGSNGITLVPIETRLMSYRKIFIEGEINSQAAISFFKEILFLNEEDFKAPIKIFINSPGGEINSGMLIYDLIQSSRAPIKIFCIGQAYSMAALIFACAPRGNRYILPHSELMLHEPALGNKVAGNSSSIRSIADSLMQTRKQLNQLFAKHTGRKEKEIEAATGFDHYFNPEEAIKFGLCDEITSLDKILED
ncbi:MAG: ATP-dependent Clp protease proteolytic subunit [Synergistaceae bacterium]|nr:ATP-dependent Clp protease proteolytic subunit [Synergistaceae bacterium]